MTVRIPGYKRVQDPRSIMWLEGTGNYTYIHLASHGHPLLVSMTLKYFEDMLPRFLRVSKSSLVNPLYIDEIVKLTPKALQLLLKDGTTISVSRRRISETIALLDGITAAAAH